MHKLTSRIHSARKEHRKALIPFITAGFPDKDDFWKQLAELDANGADIIEIGVPFSDPCADGPVVEQASIEALEHGVTLEWILKGLQERKGQYQAELVLMGYMNPFYQYGFQKLAKQAADAGISGCIIPDLPLGEQEPFSSLLAEHHIALIPLIGINTPPQRMQEYARSAQGYVYVVSIMGTTGVRASFPPELRDALSHARKAFSLPLALGFGIQDPAQLTPFGDSIDAVVFGSALLTHIRRTQSAASFMERWT